MPRTIRFDVLTLFPGIFTSYLQHSILEDAITAGLVQVHTWNIRDWTHNKHHRVDDRPYGGGPGMILAAQPVVDCAEAVQAMAEPPGRIILLTPAGERLTQRIVEQLAQEPRLLLLCGRYEGFDDRIRQLLNPWEISIGDFICNGGEVPAMVIIDSVIRLIPGVLGEQASIVDESHSELGCLEYPQYTRPRVFRGLAVPEVLLSGNHQAVAQWRKEQSELRSRARRPAPPPPSPNPRPD
ncbi:MAG: tRNA (guanosine(37)-N1)-methyltransferase TrmD [Gemmataceae bacterium]|nr:tRNA (guanosine(37)-N1)-methyltransferase TrmD [Gemmata sp.]MDW8196177.1 tRNA (guanosine(37)-N1)-methyltransferase TrmD [Gemmataceae bacterium]